MSPSRHATNATAARPPQPTLKRQPGRSDSGKEWRIKGGNEIKQNHSRISHVYWCGWVTFLLSLSALFGQVWQCGGSIEVLPCARIAHIERAHKPYTEDLTSHVRRNALRVAEVWMDEFKSHVYMAWNVPMEVTDATLWNFTANMSVLLVVDPFLWPIKIQLCHL